MTGFFAAPQGQQRFFPLRTPPQLALWLLATQPLLDNHHLEQQSHVPAAEPPPRAARSLGGTHHAPPTRWHARHSASEPRGRGALASMTMSRPCSCSSKCSCVRAPPCAELSTLHSRHTAHRSVWLWDWERGDGRGPNSHFRQTRSCAETRHSGHPRTFRRARAVQAAVHKGDGIGAVVPSCPE